MPNKKAQEKSVHQSEKRRLRNRAIRSRLSRAIRLAETAIASGDAKNAESLVKSAISEIARTNSKGVIHRNNAARHSSRLMKKLNAMGSSEAPAS